MKAILLTGMSGVGKSTVLVELACRGWSTVDTDMPEWIIHSVGGSAIKGERMWHEGNMSRLLAAPRTAPLAVAGTVINQGLFYDRFDAVVLLSAPLETMLERVVTRESNRFGRRESEREAIRRDHAEVEPLLRASATHEFSTNRPLGDVVADIELIAKNA